MLSFKQNEIVISYQVLMKMYQDASEAVKNILKPTLDNILKKLYLSMPRCANRQAMKGELVKLGIVKVRKR